MPKTTKDETISESVNTQDVQNATETVSDAKFKRTVIAFTVGAVMLLSFLLVLMCYQIVKISVERRKKAELNAEIAALYEQYESDGEELEFRRTTLYIERIARGLGYHYADDLS